MKDILQDIVAHTHALGFLELIKIVHSSEETKIESMAEDKSVVLMAKTHNPVKEFVGTFGMPNLGKLNLHLKNPEYAENAAITVETRERDGETVPTHLHFVNERGDFENDYRFMGKELIQEMLPTMGFKEPKWNIVFQPSVAAVQRLKLQSAVHSEEPTFNVKTLDGDLVFSFGDAASHAGSFVFQHDIDGKLGHTWKWPVAQVQSILNLDGEITMAISDGGAMQITVDSGMAKYQYVLPAQSK